MEIFSAQADSLHSCRMWFWMSDYILFFFFIVFSPGQVNFQFSDVATIPNMACSQVADSGKTPKYWGLAVN